jgi:hypothetical protein
VLDRAGGPGRQHLPGAGLGRRRVLAPTESEDLGLLVGDMNGDGRADIGYRGRCGNPGVAQWRYHVSADTYPFTITCSATCKF